ncbi:TPA: hypothetical protein N0F65_008537 [Lagenidium giganteum]|uniref:receptor protein-tyrosine kinase n=1 Tax=Lagenidium giganteum TaxID=4803 RepID=A0AAV2YR60_9STRA|nr:TPA: hypothetical protein N0F65_008537 [Lagenidium giganteum]
MDKSHGNQSTSTPVTPKSVFSSHREPETPITSHSSAPSTGKKPLAIPPEYRSYFSANQADELISQFELCDNDGSGYIDEHEFRELLTRLSLHVTDAEAGELVANIDADGNGQIDFQELVSMVVSIKEGDGKFQALKKFVEGLDTTPIALLEREAAKFGMQVAYALLSERKGTSSTPPSFLVELTITGKWCGPSGQETVQAIGKTTREAKFKAAEAGLLRLKKLKPGLACDPGQLPQEWLDWLMSNLERGVKARKVLRVLVEKGFTLACNLTLMQQLSVRVSSLKVRHKRQAPKGIYDDGGGQQPGQQTTSHFRSHALHPLWAHWAQQQLARGIEGQVVLDELVALGYEPEKNPFFTQSLVRRHQRDLTPDGATPTPAVQYEFWKCIEEDALEEVELFVVGGQDLDATQVDRHTGLSLTPLQLASKLGHTSIVKLLLEHGVQVDQPDAFHRTPLMLAARYGHRDVCRQLLDRGASLLVEDGLANTPLHMAAFGGCSAIADMMLCTHDDRLRHFLAQMPRQRRDWFGNIIKQAFDAIMRAKLRDNERRRFEKFWVLDATRWVYNKLFENEPLALVPDPQPFYVDFLVERYHGKLVQKSMDGESESEDDDDDEQDRPLHDPKDLINVDELRFYVDKSLRETYKHLRNKQGRTALHIACEENLVCTHELLIQCLAEKHACSPLLIDYGGKRPIELLLACRGRPGSPKGSVQHELALLQQRHDRMVAKQERLLAEQRAARRALWVAEVERLASDFQDLELLVSMKKAAQKAKGVAEECNGWNIFEEPMSDNRLFENTRSGFLQRQVPLKVREFAELRLGWLEKLAPEHSHFVERNRANPQWELYRVNGADVYFFFNPKTQQCQWHKPDDAPREWRTRRIFDALDQVEDEPDQESLRLDFSGTYRLIKKDSRHKRRLGQWFEDTAFGVTFYVNVDTYGVSVEKPVDVLHEEACRYAHVLIRDRSEEIEDHAHSWRRFYDPVTAQTFYYNEGNGDCVYDLDATSEFLKKIKKLKGSKARKRRTKEQLARQQEEQEWKKTLERARRHEVLTQANAIEAEKAQAKARELSAEMQEMVDRLEQSVKDEHLSKHHHALGYVDARFQRELEVLLDANKHELMTSLNAALERPRHEIERHNEYETTLEDEEHAHAELEDVDSARASRERRRVSRLLHKASERWRTERELCRWGCERWCQRGTSLSAHENNECERRLMICRLGCGLIREDRQWLVTIAEHEEADGQCDRRIVFCPRDCGVWLAELRLRHHMDETCVKRPVGDLPCRLGCGQIYQGGMHNLLALEQTRIAHEQDDCVLRKVECTWPKCRSIIIAKERNEHRRAHLISSGVVSFLTAEVHQYKVPKDQKKLKIQAWGGGGGSGQLRMQCGGSGGGGAFVEGVCHVHPGETLYISIGAGGSAGRFAAMRQENDTVGHGVHVEIKVSTARGGLPGGGAGHSGNKECACGGGGGFTSVYRESAFGIEYLVIAGGGGGGGTCRDGYGGSGLKAKPVEPGDDLRIGRCGSDNSGGLAGVCDEHNPICKFVGEAGQSLQGGAGAEFGGGGGGGYFGGGGGGFSPGIVGGGGGGSSFVNMSIFEPKSVYVEAGRAIVPGGMDRCPPQSARDAYWDLVDGVVGQGGKGSSQELAVGNHGGVRLARPGFFQDMQHHR